MKLFEKMCYKAGLKVGMAIHGSHLSAEEKRALERKLYKYFPILVCGDTFAGGEMMILRAVTLSGAQLMPARLPYDLVERTVARIMEQTDSITRVFYDETPTVVGKESFS